MAMDMDMGMSNGPCGHQPPSTMNSEKSEKKPQKKWTMEETQMLVAGCNKVRARRSVAADGVAQTIVACAQWGVGNWKSILNDPDFKFDGRSPVDLKDRCVACFPSATVYYGGAYVVANCRNQYYSWCWS